MPGGGSYALLGRPTASEPVERPVGPASTWSIVAARPTRMLRRGEPSDLIGSKQRTPNRPAVRGSAHLKTVGKVKKSQTAARALLGDLIFC